MSKSLLDPRQRHRAGGEGELREFLEGGIDVPVAGVTIVNPDEDRALKGWMSRMVFAASA